MFFDNVIFCFFHNGLQKHTRTQTHACACKTHQSSQRGCLKRNQRSFRLNLGFPIRPALDLGLVGEDDKDGQGEMKRCVQRERTESSAAFSVSFICFPEYRGSNIKGF